MKSLGCLIAVAILSACSPQESRETHQELKKSGEAVKKELKNDAAFLKQEALKARQETQAGVKKLKKDLNSDTKNAPASPDSK